MAESNEEELVDKEIKVTNENEEWKESNLTKAVYLLDSWFIRASWPYKKNFLFDGLELLTRDGLELIILLLGPPIKDYYYSIATFTNSTDDQIPLDNNRQMPQKILDKARDSDFEWISSLPKKQLANIIIGLTELGGSTLRMKVYERCLTLLDHLEEDVAPTEPKTGRKKQAKQKMKIRLSPDIKKDTKECRIYLKRLHEYDDFINKMKKKLGKDDQSDRKSVSRRPAKDEGDDTTIDLIQLLPFWISRQIFLYLDNDSLKQCQKVNSYWKNAVKLLQKEKDVRIKIDQSLIKLEVSENMKINTKGKSGKQSQKRKKSIKKTARTASEELLEQNRATIVDCGNDTRQDMLEEFNSARERLTFRKKYILIWTLNEYAESRVIAIGKTWIAMAKDKDITLCNLLSFAPMPGKLKGHEENVISMAFHPEDGQLVSVSKDSTLRRWDAWSRKEITQMIIPSLTRVSANKTYYVVAATNSITVFCWDQNICHWVLPLDEEMDLFYMSISIDDAISLCFLPGSVKLMNANDGCQITAIPRFHICQMTCTYHCGKYLVTGNEEGWVFIWSTNTEEPMMLARTNVGNYRKVTAVILEEGCVQIATSNGELHTWDVVYGQIVKSITINEDNTNIFSINLLRYFDHCKVIVNSETGIKVVQYEYSKTKSQGFQAPQLQRRIKSQKDVCACQNLITWREHRKDLETRRKEENTKRQSCHPNIRKDFEKILTIKESTEMLTPELSDLSFFPRMVTKLVQKINYNDMIKLKKVQEDQDIKYKRKINKEPSYKNFLPILNPYKHQF